MELLLIVSEEIRINVSVHQTFVRKVENNSDNVYNAKKL